MDDLISRKQAMDAVKDRYYKYGRFAKIEELAGVIERLPTAQPEPCEDAVNRETILKFFDDWMSVLDENCHNQSVSDLKIIKRDFANLPSVTPKQRTGKWVLVSDNNGMHFICNQCGEWRYHQEQEYCEHCGAKMEVTT